MQRKREAPRLLEAAVRAAWTLLVLIFAGCAAPDPPASGPESPSPLGVWSAQECAGVSFVWHVPLDRLAEAVGPRWTPAPGPVAGHGVFVLFAAHCPVSAIAGASTGATDVAAALVPVATPEDTLGHEAEGWLALPETMAPDGPVLRLFADAGFDTSPAAVAVDVQDAPEGVRFTVRIATAAGVVEADGVATGEPEEQQLPGGGFVSTGPGDVGLFTGPEGRTRLGTGAAVVRATGDTWSARLGLPPAPAAVTVDEGLWSQFTFYRHA